MKKYESNQIKNIAVVGGLKSGKTTLLETMLFESGSLNRRGTVEEGNTVSDYNKIEQERHNSVFTSLVHVPWRENLLNLMDCPGNDNFVGETLSALRVADAALLVMNAASGVDVGTELNWRQISQQNMPTVIAVNQMDVEKANFQMCLDQAQDRFGNEVVVVQFPYNAGPGFNCIIDVLKMVMYKFPADGGKPEKLPIPADQKDLADEYHNSLVEAAAENDESLMEIYFDKGELSEEEMKKGLSLGIAERSIFPLFILSAKHNMGSGRLMGFLGNNAPSTVEAPAEKTTAEVEVKCDKSGAPTIFVFKTSIEPHLGVVSYIKVVSGTLTSGMTLYDSRTQNSERIGQLYKVNGKNKVATDELIAGDLGATVKLKDVGTNDTLCEKGKEIEFVHIYKPSFRIREAIFAEEVKNEEKLGLALTDISKQDPTFSAGYRPEIRQMIVKGQGEMHLGVIKWRLEHEFGIKVQFGRPRISYRETIKGSAKADYRHKKQSGGSGQFGEVYLWVNKYEEGMAPPTEFNIRDTQEIPLKAGGKLVFYNCIVGGVIDSRFIPAVLKGVMETMIEGPLTGSPVRDVCVAVYDGKMHAVDSNEISFKIASAHAFKEAFKNAKPQLLEPVFEVEVLTPDDMLGDIMTDLQGRRAIILGMEAVGHFQKIKAKVPLAELYKYSTTLRSITQGRAIHTRKFAGFTLVPEELKQTLVKEFKQLEAEMA